MPELQRQQVSQWLHRNESLILRRCIEGEIAHLQAQSANAPLSDAAEFLKSKGPIQYTDAMKDAAALQIFLNIFDELSDPAYLFQTTKLTHA